MRTTSCACLFCILATLSSAGSTTSQEKRANSERFGFGDYQWGAHVIGIVTVKPFLPGRSQLTFKNDRVFFKGREVWRWSVDDFVPRNYPAEVKIKIGATEAAVPTILLRDLWEVNDNVTGWLANDKKTFDLRITCADAGMGLQV